ncbi:MAG: hypothetical protein ABJA93_03180 [Sporichthyaceae bacterium]
MRLVTGLLPNPYAAYLRVYEPLVAFAPEERATWTAYAEQAASRVERLRREHRRALVDLLSVPPVAVPVDESSDAFVLAQDAQVFVCPVQARLRAWLAFGEFRDGLPDALLHAFVPPATVRRADANRELWAGKEPVGPLRIQTATWAVPIHWFVAFSEEDRVVHLAEPDRSLVHRARMSAARRRVGRALRTLRRSIGEVSYVEELEGLGQWLEEFHPRSWLELDYGGLVHLLGDDDLRADESARDVAAALRALAAGDEDLASAAYEALVDRWAAVRALEHAN